jgi:hypothetical protein
MEVMEKVKKKRKKKQEQLPSRQRHDCICSSCRPKISSTGVDQVILDKLTTRLNCVSITLRVRTSGGYYKKKPNQM